MWRFTLVFLLGVLSCGGSLVCSGQVLERVENTTTHFPDSLPSTGFELELAFPEIRSFSQPVGIVSAPGDSNRLFVLERSGRIRVIPDLENPVRQTFLSLSRGVESGSGEQGLLGLAFHPDYQRNGTFFVFYTARAAGDPNRVSRFQVNPENPNEGLLDSEVILFSQRDDAGNHNGGDLHFGPDGYLYVSLGDEGAANDSLQNSQRLDRDFFAGILRIDVDKRPGNLEPNPHPAIVLDESGLAHYSVPHDNPFVGVVQFNGSRLIPQEVRTEFWAVGLRNPWRMAFDSASGELYTGDVGQGRREEVDIIVKGGNYGWNYREGTIDGPRRDEVPEGVEFIDPILEYGHGSRSNQGNSITGGLVYRGSRIASLVGAYLFADYASGNLWWLRHEGADAIQWENIGRESGISAFGEDPRNGDVLLADFNSSRLWRLVSSEPDEDEGDAIPRSLADTGVFHDLGSLTPNPGIVGYSINAPFWSDGAQKRRWFSVPELDATISYHPERNWGFPTGMFWVKHFELELKSGDPSSTRRLETRFIVKGSEGIYGLTYRWDDDQQNAFLVPEEGMDEVFTVEDEGGVREQRWRYPSRGECLQCHTATGGEALGFSTAQLARRHDFEQGAVEQILAYSDAGYFDEAVDASAERMTLAAIDDTTESLMHRVRSYLDSNCSQCHQPGGDAIGSWDARITTELADAGIVGGVLSNPSIRPGRRVVVPGDPSASELLQRISSLGSNRMPPLGSNELDSEAIELVREWIASFPRESYEEWSSRNFGSALNPLAAPANDHDRDGFPNSLEYELGTSPLDSEDFWTLSINRAESAIEFVFPAIPAATIGVELQVSSSLNPDASWEAVDGVEPSAFYGSRGQMKRLERQIEDAQSQFFRIVFLANDD